MKLTLPCYPLEDNVGDWLCMVGEFNHDINDIHYEPGIASYDFICGTVGRPLYIPIRPKPKPRMTKRDGWGGNQRRVVVEYFEFKDELVKQYFGYGLSNLSRASGMIFMFEPPRRITKENAHRKEFSVHVDRPDTDNMIKAVWDSLSSSDQVNHTILFSAKFWQKKSGITIVVPNGFV